MRIYRGGGCLLEEGKEKAVLRGNFEMSIQRADLSLLDVLPSQPPDSEWPAAWN